MKLRKIITGGQIMAERVLRAILSDITHNFEKLETFPETIAASMTLSLNRAHKVYWVDSSSGVIDLTLPLARDAFGQFVNVRRDAGANNVVIHAAGSDTINGAATLTLTLVNESYTLISDGNTKWGIM